VESRRPARRPDQPPNRMLWFLGRRRFLISLPSKCTFASFWSDKLAAPVCRSTNSDPCTRSSTYKAAEKLRLLVIFLSPIEFSTDREAKLRVLNASVARPPSVAGKFHDRIPMNHAGCESRFAFGPGFKAASARVSVQSTRGTPRWRVFRSPPTVLTQPKISSTRLR
jgi:hypothetical protein